MSCASPIGNTPESFVSELDCLICLPSETRSLFYKILTISEFSTSNFSVRSFSCFDFAIVYISDVHSSGNALMGIAGSDKEEVAVGFTADMQQGGIVDEWEPLRVSSQT